MILLDKISRKESIALDMDLPDILRNPLLRNLADRNLHQKDHIISKTYPISALLVCCPKLKDIYWIQKSVEQIFLISLNAILVKLHFLQIGGNDNF